MANKTINQLTEETAPTTDDFFAMWDVTTGTTKKVSLLKMLLKILTGSADWAWQSWTPTWVNLTVGNGVVEGKYIQIGKTVIFSLELTAGTTTSLSGGVAATLPVTAVTQKPNRPIGSAMITDSGVANYPALVNISDENGGASTTKMAFYYGIASGTYVTSSIATNALPFAIANTDLIVATGVYQAA